MISNKLAAHLQVDQYGDFVLTDAIRPAVHLPVIPREGYRLDTYRDPQTRKQVPVLAAAVSREKLFDVFLALIDLLGPSVDVILETSHENRTAGHRDLLREGIDLPVLASHFCDFEELLLNDGCTGVAVIASGGSMEVQFDEHKLLVVYAKNLAPFAEVFEEASVRRNDSLKLITQGEHLHSSAPEHQEQFEQLCCRVGVASQGEVVRW